MCRHSVPLKGQSNEIFEPQFFSSFEPAWATDQCIKIVSFLVSFSPRYSNFYETTRSIILRGVMCLWESYLIGHSKKKTSSFFNHSNKPGPLTNGYKYFRIWSSSPQYDTARSHSIMRGVNCHFLKLLHRGPYHKNEYIFLIYWKRASYFIFAAKSHRISFLQLSLRLNFFLTPRSIIHVLRGVSIFYTKFWISRRKQNRIRKYFNPLVSGPGWFKWWKNLGVENLVGLSL